MKILRKGKLHVGNKVSITCPYCGTRVEIIENEPGTDIQIRQDPMTNEYYVKDVFYKCPMCNTVIDSNNYDERVLSIALEQNVKLTQEEVNMVYHPDLNKDE